jgi:hypothetical protein
VRTALGAHVSPLREDAQGMAAQDEMRPRRVSEESLPSAIRSGGAGRVASDAQGVGAAARMLAKAADAAVMFFQVQTMAVSGLVDRGWFRAPL